MVDRKVDEQRRGDEGQRRDGEPAQKAAEREGRSSSSSGEAGEESWSWIAPWNFCCRIEEELLEKALIAQAIMIRPGITKTT